MSTPNSKLSDYFLRIPKCEANGSNWSIYKNRFSYAANAAGLADHLLDTHIAPVALIPATPPTTADTAVLEAFDKDMKTWKSGQAIVKQAITSSIPDPLFLRVKDAKNGCRAMEEGDFTEENITSSFDTAMPANEEGTPDVEMELYDSGASHHMSLYQHQFINYTSIPLKSIRAANNGSFQAIGQGNMRISIPNGNSTASVLLKGVLPAPSTPVPPYKHDPNSCLAIPTGNFLIVRGVFSPGEKIDPVPIVRAKVADIMAMTDASPPAATLTLDPSLVSPDPKAEPRTDLLAQWIPALDHTGWEVRWAPQAEGRDKRMWIRLADVFDGTPDESTEAKRKAEKVVSSNPLPVRYCWSPDRFTASNTALAPSSPSPILTTSTEPPTYASWSTTDDRFSSTAATGNPFSLPPALRLENATISCCPCATGLPPAAVLLDSKRFDAELGSHYHLCTPQLLFRLNTSAAWKVDPNAALIEGAEKVTGVVTALTRRIETSEHDASARDADTKARLVAIDANVTSVSNLAQTLANRQEDLGRGFLLLQQETHLSSSLARIDTSLTLARQMFSWPIDDQEKEEARAEVLRLNAERKLIQSKLDGLYAHQPAIAAPPPFTPPPPPANPPPPLPPSPTPRRPAAPSTAPATFSFAPSSPPSITRRDPDEPEYAPASHVPPVPKNAILFLASLIQTAAAASAFSMYALNANGLMQSVKLHHINIAIGARNPHSFVLTESKTDTKTGPNLPNSDYNIFEEPGVQADNNHQMRKWGLAVGIRKSIQIAQRIQITSTALRGRVVAVDVVLQTNNGQDFIHRVIGAYAPWDPGLPESCNFWPELGNLCCNTTTSWTLGGDLNTTVSTAERRSGGAEARSQFLHFLERVNGHNIWPNYPNRNRNFDWTSRANDETNTGNIIDRVITSKRSYLDAEIAVADQFKDFVPHTNHCAVVAKIVYTPPSGTGGTVFPAFNAVLNKARIKYPSRMEKHRHDDFRTEITSRLNDSTLEDIAITDDESFLHVYESFTHILIPSVESSYGRVP
ncbi:hypothetical protein C8R44DRAFT_874714 [Mycena epipterygia]|nr:hypothetical protein C8R44DRAFT_874714 [Mycena epipterygia]